MRCAPLIAPKRDFIFSEAYPSWLIGICKKLQLKVFLCNFEGVSQKKISPFSRCFGLFTLRCAIYIPAQEGSVTASCVHISMRICTKTSVLKLFLFQVSWSWARNIWFLVLFHILSYGDSERWFPVLGDDVIPRKYIIWCYLFFVKATPAMVYVLRRLGVMLSLFQWWCYSSIPT